MRSSSYSWCFLASWIVLCVRAWAHAENGFGVGHPSSAPGDTDSTRRLAGASTGGTYDPMLIETIHLVEKMEMWEQRMTQEFLLVAYGYEVEEYKHHLHETIVLFDDAFHDLETGDAPKNIMKPPNDGVAQELASSSKEWSYYKGLLETEYNLLLGHHKSYVQ